MAVASDGTSAASLGWARACQVARHPGSAVQSVAAATAAIAADSVVGLVGAVIGGVVVIGPREGTGLDWNRPARAWNFGFGFDSEAATR